MKRIYLLSWTAIVWWLMPHALAEARFAVKLVVSSETAQQVATNESSPQRRDARPHPVFQAKANENLTLHWRLDAKGATSLENVLVHFYVAQVDESDPKQLPNLKKPENVVLEGALTMDFKGKNGAQSELSFRAPPGRYWVRVEALHDLLPPNEPVAAMELEVK